MISQRSISSHSNHTSAQSHRQPTHAVALNTSSGQQRETFCRNPTQGSNSAGEAPKGICDTFIDDESREKSYPRKQPLRYFHAVTRYTRRMSNIALDMLL